MVLEERSPRLGRWFPAADQILAHAGFAHIDAQLEQFAVDPRRAPERVLAAHRPNQAADLLRHGRSPGLAPSTLPVPKQAKTFAVPANDGRGLNEEDTGPPAIPDLAQPSPQESIRRGQFRPFHGALQNPDLMAECEDLQVQCRAAPEPGGKGCEER